MEFTKECGETWWHWLDPTTNGCHNRCRLQTYGEAPDVITVSLQYPAACFSSLGLLVFRIIFLFSHWPEHEGGNVLYYFQGQGMSTMNVPVQFPQLQSMVSILALTLLCKAWFACHIKHFYFKVM